MGAPQQARGAGLEHGACERVNQRRRSKARWSPRQGGVGEGRDGMRRAMTEMAPAAL